MYDLTKIMKQAWALAKGVDEVWSRPCHAAQWAQANTAERRRMFRLSLKRAWNMAKTRLANIARRAADEAAEVAREAERAARKPRPMTPAEVELLTLECKDHWTQADFRRAQELRFAI